MKSHLSGLKNLKISACTITKNEEKNIARSINSYKDAVDEIIIVDTGSTDNTVKIARELGAKVYEFEWCNDFSAAKNTAVSKATGDWILVLDADEYFEDDGSNRIREAILRSEMNGNNCIGCRMKNYDINTGEELAEIFTIRILKSGFKFRFAIHEEPHYENGMNVMTADKTWFTIGHSGYSARLMPDKARRNLEILKNEYENSSDSIYKTSCLSYISDSYYSLKEFNDSIEYAKRFIEESKKYKLSILGCETKPYLNILFSLQSINADGDEIEYWVEKFKGDFPDCADAIYWQGNIEERHYRFKSALGLYKRAFKIIDNYEGTYPLAIASEMGNLYNSCARAYEGNNDIPKAMEWYFKAYTIGSSMQVAAFNLMRLVKSTPQEDLDAFVNALIKSADNSKTLALMAGLMCNYMSRQLFDCYAVYKGRNKLDKLDAQVSAYLMAGRGEYAAAAQLFLINNEASRTNDGAIRCLLFSVLSKNEDLIKQALNISKPEHAFAMGLLNQLPDDNPNIGEISNVYAECAKFKGAAFAGEFISVAADKLSDTQLIKLARLMINKDEYETAMLVLDHAKILPESVFLRGISCYRLQRFYEAKDLLALSKHIGYNNGEIAEIYELTVAAFSANCMKNDECSDDLKQKIRTAMESGNIKISAELIEKYRNTYKSDAEIYSAHVLALFYSNDYNKAALTAEAGLLNYSDDADLLFNAGCVYEKLGNTELAKTMYKKSIAVCNDPDVAEEIKQALNNINRRCCRGENTEAVFR